jgi:TRAP transporter 4TM/12TM fusion protein
MRQLEGLPRYLTNFIAAMFSALFIYTSGFGLISIEIHRGGYLLFTYLLVFLLFPFRRRSKETRVPFYDWVLCAITTIVIGYWIFTYPVFSVKRIGNPNQMDIIIGGILILLSFEVARRVVGYVLTTLAALFLLFAYFGPYVPGILGHYGYTIPRMIEFLASSMGGIYGIVTNTYATFIFPFVIFATFLQAAGAGKAISEISLALAGGTRGGPAKVAVIASGFIGSVTGSSAANAVATGSYTIPMMISAGYRPHVAAAVEAAASTGGQFLPPVMGAAAFLIAAFTDTPYWSIVEVSIIPAILYFLGVGMMVHFIAARRRLAGLPKAEIPNLKYALLHRGYLLLPIVVILLPLMFGYSANMSAFYAIISTFLLSFIRKETRMTFSKVIEGLKDGARTSLMIGSTAGVIGIIIGTVTLTGAGIKFSAVVLALSKGILPLTILLVAVGGYIIGMGVTITATYILLSVLAVPALMDYGIPLLTAHLIVFWFCEIGGVTPPVALVAFAASGIAKCDPNRAGFAAVRLASPLFIMPFLFAYTPLLLNGPLPNVIETILSVTIGIIAYAGMMQGYWLRMAHVPERILLGAGAVSLFVPSIYSDLIGLGLLAIATIVNLRREI